STWTEVSNTVTNTSSGIHVDQHALAWAGTRLIAGNDGGVWSTTDAGSTWNDHNTGLSIIQFYYGALHPTNNSIIYAGSQDNGTSKYSGSNPWSLIGSGDGGEPIFSSTSPNTKWATAYQYAGIERTLDGGATIDNPSGITGAG